MASPERLDPIHIAFDDHRLVAHVGLVLLATLAHHLGMGGLVSRHVCRVPRLPKLPSKIAFVPSMGIPRASGSCG